MTPKAYADAHRGKRVREELAERHRHRGDLRRRLQFHGSRFYADRPGARHDADGIPRRRRGNVIRFAVGECSLGAILVAATDKGVCAIDLGDDPDALVRGLQDRFPNARLVGGDAAFEQLVAKVVGFVEAPAQGSTCPLDIRGTAFQQRVWQAIRGIPAGIDRKLRRDRRRIGAPKAVRAVAQACASNALAVAIPCHRVVRTDGDCRAIAGALRASARC